MERDQSSIDNPFDPAIKLLDRGIQRHIRQEWGSFLTPPTAPQICSATSLSCANLRDEVEPPTNYLNRLRGKKTLLLEGNICTDFQQAIHRLFGPSRSDLQIQKDIEGPLPSRGQLIPAVRQRSVAAAIRRAGSSTAQSPDGLKPCSTFDIWETTT